MVDQRGDMFRVVWVGGESTWVSENNYSTLELVQDFLKSRKLEDARQVVSTTHMCFSNLLLCRNRNMVGSIRTGVDSGKHVWRFRTGTYWKAYMAFWNRNH